METPKSKGPWINRFAIRFFTVVLAIIIFWLLGFLVEDIRSIPGPDYDSIESKHLDKGLVEKETTQARQIEDLSREIENQKESQRLLASSSQNLQQTINQLLELRKLGMEKNVAATENEQANTTSSLSLFLENQRKYQQLNQSLSDLVKKQQELNEQNKALQAEIEQQRVPAREEFNQVSAQHRLRLAFLQLAVLLPLLLISAVLILKKRTGIYFPLFLAFASATLLKVGFVVHEYFPARYVKYILIIALLLAVARVLIHFIRTIAFPNVQWLLKQYREAYERFLCPICEYPIRVGPRKFLFWTRGTVNKLVVPNQGGAQEEAYTCPACGTALFEECGKCHQIRHALLPHCNHCGNLKPTE